MARATGKDHSQINLDIARTLHAGDHSGWWRHYGRPGQWCVYTLHEARRRIVPPLYVGVTSQLYDRLSHHRRGQAWWPLVGDIVVEHFDNRPDAYEAEERRIYALKPLFNVAGNVHTPEREIAATEVTL